MSTDTSTAPAPAVAAFAAAPAAPPRRGFARAGAAAVAAPAASANAADATPTQPAEAEQVPSNNMLVDIDFEAALQHSSDGLYPGEIISAKPTKGGNGIYVSVRHVDGTVASCNYMLFRAVKDENKQPKLDAAGKQVMERDVSAQKAWASFCGALGLVPQEVTRGIVDFANQKTADKPAIVGLTLMWNFKQNGDFLNCSYNDAATQEMTAAGGPPAT